MRIKPNGADSLTDFEKGFFAGVFASASFIAIITIFSLFNFYTNQ